MMKYGNGQKIGDGLRLLRVTAGGTRFFIMTDQKTERFAEVFFTSDDPVPGLPPVRGVADIHAEQP